MRNLRNFLRYVRQYACRKDIDWTLSHGDQVYCDHWRGPVEIVNINWDLWAAAVRVSPDYDAIVVWPLWSLYRDER